MQSILLLLVVLPALGGLFSWYVGRDSERDRDIFNIALTALEFLVITMLFPMVYKGELNFVMADVMGTGLHLKLDLMRYVFVWLTSGVWFLTTVYSAQYLIKYKNRNRYYVFFMMTLASTIGFFLSENMLNMFTFFEVLSFTSYFLIIHDEDRYAHRAGMSYISMAVTGGLVMLLGIFILYDQTGTLNLTLAQEQMALLGDSKYVIGGLLIFGFGVKAAIVPLHVWLPKAHPAAPTPASAILSGILIKVGIFGILITSHILMSSDSLVGMVLVAIGLMGMFSGGFQALFQRNIKRILAYSSMSQAGYLVFAIGLGAMNAKYKGMALLAVLMHVINHGIFKVLLFMGAGIIYMILHELSLNAISGFGKNKKILKVIFFIGTLALIGFPGTGGYVSKTLIHETMTEVFHYYAPWVQVTMEVAFTLASAMTTAYMLKIFISVFMTDNPAFAGQYKEHVKKRALLPMAILSLGVLLVGLFPSPLIHTLEHGLEVFHAKPPDHLAYYSWKAIQSALITIALGSILYATFLRKRLRRAIGDKRIWINPTISWPQLEENVYLPVILKLSDIALWVFHRIDGVLLKSIVLVRFGLARVGNVDVSRLFELDWSRLDFTKQVKHTDIDVDELTESVKHTAAQAQQRVDKKVKDVVQKAHNRASSMTWALYMVASVLLLVLGWMLIRGM